MKSGQVIKRITDLGGVELRQRGSHRRFEAVRGEVKAQTTVPERNRDLGPGLISAIQRQMEPVFGKGWLK